MARALSRDEEVGRINRYSCLVKHATHTSDVVRFVQCFSNSAGRSLRFAAFCAKMAAARILVKSSSRPATRERAPSCTHLQLTRLFDGFGCDQCSICHRRPQIGWLYRCTQDSDGFLPASDFYDAEDRKPLDQDAHLYTLSPAITKAAANGDYTDQELNILWEQKFDVRRAIRQVRPDTSSSVSTASSSQYSLPASTTTSSILSDSDPDTDLSQLSDYLPSCRGPLEPIQEVHADLENDHRLLPLVKPVALSPCNFKVCQTCRPIYQQRAWQSIDSVLKTPYKPPPKHELANRRISDVNVVKTIGLSLYISTPHNRRHFETENDPSKRNSRTQFQDIVQQLLRDQERLPEEYRADTEQQSHMLRRSAAVQSLFQPNPKDTSDNALSEKASQTSSDLPQPLYHEHGSERFTSVQSPPTRAKSQYGDSRCSTELPTSQNHQSRTAMNGLKIDTTKANEDRENVSPNSKDAY